MKRNIKAFILIILMAVLIYGAVVLFQTISYLNSELNYSESRLATVESEYKEYQDLMKEYESLSRDELAVRKYQMKLQAEYVKIIEESEAVEESKRAEEAEKIGYNTGITYFQLAHAPSLYEGQKVKFYGKAIQVLENEREVDVRLSTKMSNYGNYVDDILYIYYDPTVIKYRVVEDDMVTIYGVAEGVYTYTSVNQQKITLPLIRAERIEIQGLN